MSQNKTTKPQSDEKMQDAVEPAKACLQEVLEEIDTPEKSEAVVEKLVDEKATQPAVEVAEKVAPDAEEAPPLTQAEVAAEAIEEAAESDGDDIDRAAEVLEVTAAEVTALEGPAYEALTEKVQQVTAPELHNQPDTLGEQRRHLRDALKKHPGVGWLKSHDAELFVFINNLTPRTAATDAFFYQLSAWFSGGLAWLIGVALARMGRPDWTTKTLMQLMLPIWIAGAVVEGPVKIFFRRRRPFIDIVRAIVVGKKPGNWSFPSGHSAVAFAGARMFSRYLPRWRPLWYTLAGLVGFSRIYLGAHYPGDVVSGSLCGVTLAGIAHWFLKKIIN